MKNLIDTRLFAVFGLTVVGWGSVAIMAGQNRADESAVAMLLILVAGLGAGLTLFMSGLGTAEPVLRPVRVQRVSRPDDQNR